MKFQPKMEQIFNLFLQKLQNVNYFIYRTLKNNGIV